MKKPKLRIPVAPPTIVHKDKRPKYDKDYWQETEPTYIWTSRQMVRQEWLMKMLRYLKVFNDKDYE